MAPSRIANKVNSILAAQCEFSSVEGSDSEVYYLLLSGSAKTFRFVKYVFDRNTVGNRFEGRERALLRIGALKNGAKLRVFTIVPRSNTHDTQGSTKEK